MQTAAGAESLQESFELHLSTSHLRMENWVSRNNSIVLIQPANPMCLDLDCKIVCDQTILTSKVCHGWLALRELGSITTNLNGHQDQRAWLVLCRVDNDTRPKIAQKMVTENMIEFKQKQFLDILNFTLKLDFFLVFYKLFQKDTKVWYFILVVKNCTNLKLVLQNFFWTLESFWRFKIFWDVTDVQEDFKSFLKACFCWELNLREYG